MKHFTLFWFSVLFVSFATMKNAVLLALGLASFGCAAPVETRQAQEITLEAEDGELTGTEVLTALAGFSGKLHRGLRVFCPR